MTTARQLADAVGARLLGDRSGADVDLTGAVAVAVGSEKYGLTDIALERAQHHVRIPMVGRANSLNVATSAAIVAYEALRHRSRGLSGQDSHPG